MIHDLDIYRSAQILIREHGEDAAVALGEAALLIQRRLYLAV